MISAFVYENKQRGLYQLYTVPAQRKHVRAFDEQCEVLRGCLSVFRKSGTHILQGVRRCLRRKRINQRRMRCFSRI